MPKAKEHTKAATKPKRKPVDNKIQQVKKAMLEALEKSMGVVTTACKQVGIDRSTFYKYYNTDEAFAAAVAEIDNVALDFAESSLYKQISAGVPASTIFFLKTKGKKRGYIETTINEHSGPNGGPIQTENKHDLSKLSTEQLIALKDINKKLNS